MPLLDHFHPPLSTRRHWESFHGGWIVQMMSQLNLATLPEGYHAELRLPIKGLAEIDVASSHDPDVVVDVTTREKPRSDDGSTGPASSVWIPPRPTIIDEIEFARLDRFEVRIYQDLGGVELRAAIELISPANKDRAGSRRTFAAKCAGYLQHGIGVVIVDVVTARSANLHEELFDTLEVKSRKAVWQSATGLYAVAYRPVTVRKSPRVEAWTETLTLGAPLPIMPLWLALDLCVPVRLEESYLETCRSLRIPA